jgi:hypothetical protein
MMLTSASVNEKTTMHDYDLLPHSFSIVIAVMLALLVIFSVIRTFVLTIRGECQDRYHSKKIKWLFISSTMRMLKTDNKHRLVIYGIYYLTKFSLVADNAQALFLMFGIGL